MTIRPPIQTLKRTGQAVAAIHNSVGRTDHQTTAKLIQRRMPLETNCRWNPGWLSPPYASRTALRHQLAPPAALSRPTPSPLPAAFNWDGPDPFEDFSRDFTAQGGIKLTFKVKDLRAWRWWLRLALWLLALGGTLWFALRASPYPLVPRACRDLASCLTPYPILQIALNLGLLLLMGYVCWKILFVEEQTLASIEIRKDCMIVEGHDIFWVRKMQLGWPQLRSGPEGTTLLCGVYGTRFTEYMTLYTFDPLDCTVQLVGAHLQHAMQQLWDQPGGAS